LLSLADKVVVMRDGAVERMATRNEPAGDATQAMGGSKVANMSLEPGEPAQRRES
jgi:ABC-type sugar transport system ATPase subunit